MKAVVVYESLWGNTAAIGRAIAEGIGSDAQAYSTAEATREIVSAADLIVAGAPLMAFHVPTDKTLESVADNPSYAKKHPDLSQPSMRSWLDTLPQGRGFAAAFETKLNHSPGRSAKTILHSLEDVGYTPIAEHERFIVTGSVGPLRDGEIERAREWGAELARRTTEQLATA